MRSNAILPIMTIQELHANEELRRREFPVCAERIFLGHAGVCPLPRRVVDAVTDYTRLAAMGDQEDAFAGTRIKLVKIA